MPLPDVVIIGAQKSGTTWLARVLNEHPMIRIPRGERHFFNDPQNWNRGVEWYRTRIPQRETEGMIVGEKTANYLWARRPPHVTERLSDAPARMVQVIPDAKLIAIVRDPVERAISAYNHFLRGGEIPPWRDIDEVLTGRYRDFGEKWGILSMGLYATQLRQFLEHYSRDQILVLIFERDVVENPRGGLEKVYEFLEVAPEFGMDLDARVNSARRSEMSVWLNYLLGRRTFLSRKLDRWLGPMEKRRPDEGSLERLRAYYRSDVQELEQMLGVDLTEWKNPGRGVRTVGSGPDGGREDPGAVDSERRPQRYAGGA